MSGWLARFRSRFREPRAGLVVTASTELAPGRYLLPDPAGGALRIAADDLVLDGQGALLDGGGRGGVGVVLAGRRRVVVRNLTVRGYAWALVAIDCEELLVEDCDFSANGRSDGTFLDITRSDEGAGGGARLLRTSASRIARLRATGQDIGVDLVSCRGIVVADCDLSHNAAWGIRLHGSTECRLERNRARHVNRCGGTGCDAAGILLTWGSHRNCIAGNDLRWSGDGFFLGNQFSPPSNDNLVVGNDGSYSPNNAFEATFSRGNVFRRNRACWSNYGFWLGFSTDTVLEENLITDNRTDGVHWEHGARGTLRANLIARNGRDGVAFTLDPANRDFPDRSVSTGHQLRDNRFVANGRAAVFLLHTTATRLSGNRYEAERTPVLLAGDTRENEIQDVFGTT
ncbi:right-handed parallel beta-helix repeat-containing protein [Thermomicrobium sp. 4228-Ro]|uniref:right-handed parallel beta-helix repeat-containing protein n=1 Tax=Thermomicrobium sp. 4228-Ro TaxID=2993937 RepID=UPI002248C62F|nr:right-handed parallel beta-helix repeat-containing protein [Thermomicrobium sp. 4228-Ro]MCX2728109.1 right-handed parallel beta-helix repeat-containing protein [Thermomicrobium sp. 4228-Ro]